MSSHALVVYVPRAQLIYSNERQIKWDQLLQRDATDNEFVDEVLKSKHTFGREKFPSVEVPNDDGQYNDYSNDDQPDAWKDCTRVTYPTHMPKDIDKNHTHFIFVKDFSKKKTQIPKSQPMSQKSRDTLSRKDNWDMWEDALMVRDTFEDYLKGKSFIELKNMHKESESDQAAAEATARKNIGVKEVGEKSEKAKRKQ